MTTDETHTLQSAVHRQTAPKSDYWGCWLAKHRRKHDLSIYDQAVRIKLTEDELSRLALCKAPRVTHLHDDIAEVAGHLNVREKWLEALWQEIEGPPWGCPHGQDLCGNAYGLYCQQCWDERTK